jgi:hypothetical protein
LLKHFLGCLSWLKSKNRQSVLPAFSFSILKQQGPPPQTLAPKASLQAFRYYLHANSRPRLLAEGAETNKYGK